MVGGWVFERECVGRERSRLKKGCFNTEINRTAGGFRQMAVEQSLVCRKGDVRIGDDRGDVDL